MLEIVNAGQEIASTNYWATDAARRGLVYLSGNSGALRLLLPDAQLQWVPDITASTSVTIEASLTPGANRPATEPRQRRAILGLHQPGATDQNDRGCFGRLPRLTVVLAVLIPHTHASETPHTDRDA